MSFIGLDVGTTSARAIAFDEDGESLASSSRPLYMVHRSPGRIEQDPEQILRSSIEVLEDLAERLPSPPKAIGIANQRETVTAWHREKLEPLAPAISWQDRRGAARCRELRLLGAEEYIREVSGLRLDPYFSATKYSEIASSLSSMPSANLALGTLDSWLVAKLTGHGSPVTDFTNASRSSLFNINSGRYDKSLGALFDVPLELLPTPLPSNSMFGEISCRELSKWHGVPIHAVLGDQQASLFGQHCFSFGECKATLGTGTFVLANTGNQRLGAQSGLITSIAWELSGIGTTYCLEGSIFSTASTLQWLIDVMGIAESMEELDSLARSIRSSDQVALIPFFDGTGSPWWADSSSAMIAGLDTSSSKAHVARAGFESIALQTAFVTDEIATQLGGPVQALTLDGGLSNLDFLCQLIADQTSLQCNASSMAEATAYGVAMMSAVGIGAIGLEEIASARRTRKSFDPSANRTAPRSRSKKWSGYLAKLGLVGE